MSLKLATIVGARPQFIKAAAVSRAIRAGYIGRIDETLVHTGQHFDDNMSKVFFDELDIPRPAYDLQIAGGPHGEMTGRMLEAIERVLILEQPDRVIVHGDTNSTLAGALAAVKLHIPVVHVEAGLRSFNRLMPEEINRILVDRVSAFLACPTETAVRNLHAEGIVEGVHNCGDVMYDAAMFYRVRARSESTILERLGLKSGTFALATCHRAENTDHIDQLREILSALAQLAADLPVVLPLHPRTAKLIAAHSLAAELGAVRVIEPQPFLDMVALEQAARVILTDSGGVQKEAYFYRVPCVTMREETEWVETVAAGWNCLAGARRTDILAAASAALAAPMREDVDVHPYGQGDAAGRILAQLMSEAGQPETKGKR